MIIRVSLTIHISRFLVSKGKTSRKQDFRICLELQLKIQQF